MPENASETKGHDISIDPDAEYRVLYAASQLVSCYVEILARYRPDYALLAELNAMDGENDYQQIGIIPDEWFEKGL